MEEIRNSNSHLRLLSELVLVPASGKGILERHERNLAITVESLEELKALAISNHVIVRAFEPLQQILQADGNSETAEWVANAARSERDRIHHALDFLAHIVGVLEAEACPVTVIKSLDHWPDLGSDLDLYTDAKAEDVVQLLSTHFKAKLAARSWGDRLANKWNFIVPGLPELVELHAGRLGQTGEQTAITRSLTQRARRLQLDGHLFRVAGVEDRIIISTLQRMYRHFYIRLCDIADNVALLDSHAVDFDYLRRLGSEAGIWEGIATYLAIISEYVEAFRGHKAPLDPSVADSAKFGADQIQFRRNFLRVPILPQSVDLYASELKTLLLKGELRNSLRLSLLPCLATAAALEQKITGSDKGIW